MKRRQFISTSAIAYSSLSVASALAIDPFKRPIPGRMRLSLAAYSMRKYLTAKSDGSQEMDLFGFVDYCRAHGLGGTELTSYYFPSEVDDDYLLRLRRYCHLAGVTISGGAIRNDFCSRDEAKVAADIAHTKLWVDHYAKLGAPVIRIFAGHKNDAEPLEQTIERCAKHCQTVCEYAEKKGVLLALENHGGITATSEGLLSIVKQVDSPAFGVNFDSGNFRAKADPYSELQQIAPYAVNAQIKVEITKNGRKQVTDLDRVLSILRDSGYSGWVALEYEASEEPRDAIPGWLERLKVLLA